MSISIGLTDLLHRANDYFKVLKEQEETFEAALRSDQAKMKGILKETSQQEKSQQETTQQEMTQQETTQQETTQQETTQQEMTQQIQPIQTRSGRELFIFEACCGRDPTVGDLRKALKRKRLICYMFSYFKVRFVCFRPENEFISLSVSGENNRMKLLKDSDELKKLRLCVILVDTI